MNKEELIKYFFETSKNKTKYDGFGGDLAMTLLILREIVLGEKDDFSEEEIKEIFRRIESGWI